MKNIVPLMVVILSLVGCSSDRPEASEQGSETNGATAASTTNVQTNATVIVATTKPKLPPKAPLAPQEVQSKIGDAVQLAVPSGEGFDWITKEFMKTLHPVARKLAENRDRKQFELPSGRLDYSNPGLVAVRSPEWCAIQAVLLNKRMPSNQKLNDLELTQKVFYFLSHCELLGVDLKRSWLNSMLGVARVSRAYHDSKKEGVLTAFRSQALLFPGNAFSRYGRSAGPIRTVESWPYLWLEELNRRITKLPPKPNRRVVPEGELIYNHWTNLTSETAPLHLFRQGKGADRGVVGQLSLLHQDPNNRAHLYLSSAFSHYFQDPDWDPEVLGAQGHPTRKLQSGMRSALARLDSTDPVVQLQSMEVAFGREVLASLYVESKGWRQFLDKYATAFGLSKPPEMREAFASKWEHYKADLQARIKAIQEEYAPVFERVSLVPYRDTGRFYPPRTYLARMSKWIEDSVQRKKVTGNVKMRNGNINLYNLGQALNFEIEFDSDVSYTLLAFRGELPTQLTLSSTKSQIAKHTLKETDSEAVWLVGVKHPATKHLKVSCSKTKGRLLNALGFKSPVLEKTTSSPSNRENR